MGPGTIRRVHRLVGLVAITVLLLVAVVPHVHAGSEGPARLQSPGDQAGRVVSCPACLLRHSPVGSSLRGSVAASGDAVARVAPSEPDPMAPWPVCSRPAPRGPPSLS